MRWDWTATVHLHRGLCHWRHSYNYCEHGRLYLSQYLLMLFQYPLHAPKSILHPFWFKSQNRRHMKACSWLIAPVDKDVELVYIMIGDSTRHVSTWRCVEKSLRSDVNEFEDMSTRMRFDSRAWGWASVNGGWRNGDVMISRSRLLVRKSHFTNVYVSLDTLYIYLSCVSTSDFMFFLIQRSFGWVLRSF